MGFRKVIGGLTALAFSVAVMDAAVAGSLANEGDAVKTAQHTSYSENDNNQPLGSSSGPTTSAVKIVQVRPYVSQGADPGTVLIQVDQTTACSSAIYAINMVSGGSKEAYATALVAMIQDKPVVIELADCSGSTPAIRSITLSH